MSFIYFVHECLEGFLHIIQIHHKDIFFHVRVDNYSVQCAEKSYHVKNGIIFEYPQFVKKWVKVNMFNQILDFLLEGPDNVRVYVP